MKLCKTPPCQTLTPPDTLLSRRRPGPGSPAGPADAAGPSSSAEDAPTPGTKPRVAQCERAPRTFSMVRTIFAFSSLSNSILAALADSASPMSAPPAATAQASITTACQPIGGRRAKNAADRDVTSEKPLLICKWKCGVMQMLVPANGHPRSSQMLRFKAAAKVASRKSAWILTVSAQCAQVRNPSYLKECTVAAAKIDR